MAQAVVIIAITMRFSSSGAGNLANFSAGEIEGQYDIKQFVIDGAYFYKGFNAQAEYHEKDIVRYCRFSEQQ